MLQKENIEQLGFGDCLILGEILEEGWMLCCVCSKPLHRAADLHEVH